MKLLLLASLFLLGCDGKTDGNTELRELQPVQHLKGYKLCFDNVIYVSAHRRLAVYINPKTLTPQNCGGQNEKK